MSTLSTLPAEVAEKEWVMWGEEKKCPLCQMFSCYKEQCSWWLEAEECCAIVRIARSVKGGQHGAETSAFKDF